MQLTATARILNQQWRYDPDTGFLRCTAAILKTGVMTYLREEIEASMPPDTVGDTVRIYVPPEALEEAASIASLEGVPACVGHIWQTAGNIQACGSVAGAPVIQGDKLVADILTTDQDAVRRIMLPETDPERLEEISSAGDWAIEWTPGTSPTGEAYDGVFVKIRYNHIALLPAGAGRAGAEVRIINQREVPKMEFTRVKLRGKTIRVVNEDVAAMEQVENEMETEVKNAVSPEELNAALEELQTLKAEVGDKNARIKELEGTIQSYKDQLEAALSDANIEEAAAEMAEEREEAVEIMNAAGVKPDFDVKKLRGHELRAKVVNSLRIANSKPALTEDEAKDQSFVKGMYGAYASGAQARKTVTGAGVVQVNNAAPQDGPNMANSRDRFQKMYGNKEGK